MEKKVEKKIDAYYENHAEKLHRIVNKIVLKYYGGAAGTDMEDFYGIGTDALIEIWQKDTYDASKGDFDSYVYHAIKMAIIDEMKRRCRDKRTAKMFLLDRDGNKVTDEKTGRPIKISVPDVRLDEPVKEDETTTRGELLQSDFNLEDLLFQKDGEKDERVEAYLNSLSKVTRQIVKMKMERIPVSDIKRKLQLSEKEYSSHMNQARMNENIALFTKYSNRYKEGNGLDHIIPIDVTDNYRMDKFPLGSLLDDMRDGKINKKHILQRKAFQWTERQKNKYLTRVLNGQPIPEIVICEQTVKGKKKSHLIDGLQRLSYAELFRADGIVVKLDGAEFYEIPYKEYRYDREGKILVDEEGDALFEEKVFNVIGKKFSEFPPFLKERFHKFNINVTTYFNCTDEQIAYHIRNYNNQEGMNKNQYEFTGMDVKIAERIKSISEKHPFFKDHCGKYTEKNRTKGDLDKVVVESIMAIHFIDDWKKEVKDSFAFVNQNAEDDMFDALEDSLDRLSQIVDKEVKNMFTTVNSPVWFAVLETFREWEIPDKRFKDFIKYVSDAMDHLEIDGKAFIELYKSKNTRDKSMVTGKVNGLITLMHEFFQIDETDRISNRTEAFIAKNLGLKQEEVHANMDFYEACLTDLTDQSIKDGSKLLKKENHASLLAMFVYSFENNINLKDWLTKYAANTQTYFTDQKKNYIHMRNDLDRFMKNNKKSA